MNAETKILLAYKHQQTNKLYFNEIKRATKLSNSSLQNALKKLTNKHILKTTKTTAHTYYHLHNKKYTATIYAQEAIQEFENLPTSIRAPLRDLQKTLPTNTYTAILFGSARTTNTPNDIDILVVTHQQTTINTQEAQNTSQYPISLFTCTTKEFLQTNDEIIQQAKTTGMPIHNEQTFYEAILDEHQQAL